jgi:hypothetical protein
VDIGVVLGAVDAELGGRWRLGRRLAGGWNEGAYLLIGGGGARAVLKWRAGDPERLLGAWERVAAARARGWPAPKWLATGQAPAGGAWVVQEFIAGRTPPRLDDFVAEQMTGILGLQEAMFPGAAGGWGQWAPATPGGARRPERRRSAAPDREPGNQLPGKTGPRQRRRRRRHDIQIQAVSAIQAPSTAAAGRPRRRVRSTQADCARSGSYCHSRPARQVGNPGAAGPEIGLRTVTGPGIPECANSRRYTGDRRSPSPSDRITADTRVIITQPPTRWAEMITRVSRDLDAKVTVV